MANVKGQTKTQSPEVIVGLGNPGEQYKYTRHSIGFAAIDALAEKLGANYWKSQAGCLTCAVNYSFGGQVVKLVLAKPQDYMNTSGGPVSKLLRELKLAPAELLVIHDEVDLPDGEIKSKFGGGLNAHNGLRSIADKLQTRDFGRIRTGIGRPPGKMSVADYALRTLKGEQLIRFEILAQEAADMALQLVEGKPYQS